MGSKLDMIVEYDEALAVYHVCAVFIVSLEVLSVLDPSAVKLSSDSDAVEDSGLSWGRIETHPVTTPIVHVTTSTTATAVVEDPTASSPSETSSSSPSSLPVLDAIKVVDASPTVDPSTTIIMSAPSRLFRILVVDDSSICQKLLVKILRQHSFIADVANNGQEACDKLTEVPCCYDAVLMDIRMPVMDGITATKVIRNELQLQIPIIAVSAEIDPSTRAAAMDAGTDGFLSKPSKLSDVLSLLKQTLQI